MDNDTNPNFLARELFLLASILTKSTANKIFLAEDESSSKNICSHLSFLLPKDIQIIHFPSLDTIPYDRMSPDAKISAKRMDCLGILANCKPEQKIILVTAAENFASKLPNFEYIKANILHLCQSQKISLAEIAKKLISFGFVRNSVAVDSGEFAIRGDILDCVISDTGYRINFNFDQIESIKTFDTMSQTSVNVIPECKLFPANEVDYSNEGREIFATKFLSYFGVNHTQSSLYQAVFHGRKLQGYENFYTIFYNKTQMLLDFVPNAEIFMMPNAKTAILEYEKSYQDLYLARIEANKKTKENFYYALPVDEFVLPLIKIEEYINPARCTSITPQLLEEAEVASIQTPDFLNHEDYLKYIIENFLQKKPQQHCIICLESEYYLEQIAQSAEELAIKYTTIRHLSESVASIINFTIFPMLASASWRDYVFFILPKKDQRQRPNRGAISQKKLKNIMMELDNIGEGSLVVHQDHGIGRFQNLETVKLHNSSHDCLKILYADDAIFYLPVENLSLIKKYGDYEVALDKLGGLSWQTRKAKTKDRIREIAYKLIEVAAKRALLKAKNVHFSHELYEKFCTEFRYIETQDQIRVIEEIKEDFESGKLMDRLICGDVGFGKTEIAMRAAFMIASDLNENNPQIVIVTPTTILCKQHYQNFVERFKLFPQIKIVQLSRLVSAQNQRTNLEKIKDGNAHIIIATHAIFSQNVKFYNLKLVVIDEEQHFGVKQKEKLKQMKENTHVISMSATPIPRTLQMSMLGIKDLSLITTPPISRLPIKTSIIEFDMLLIKEALMREKFRGGCSFYVCPRISDIDFIKSELSAHVPELRVKVAHGRIGVGQIDEIMTEFYEHKFDVLISTTIIESGVDIPIANTMIIHRSDMFGLGQLYQLRGRVGRGKVRGYVYLSLMPEKINNEDVLRRLETLENITSLGAGFMIASQDMDIRGAGNLLGEEQSGNIKEVGAELYQDMLQAEIDALHKEGVKELPEEFTPSVNLNVPIFIPDNYIADSALKLSIYRKVSYLSNEEDMSEFVDEMIDRFGPIPDEMKNLLNIVQIRNKCHSIGIKSLDAGPGGFVIKFHENFGSSAKLALEFMSKYPREVKLKQDKLIYIKKLEDKNLIKEANRMLENMRTCV